MPTLEARRRTAKDPLPQYVAADRGADAALHEAVLVRELNLSKIKVHPPEGGVCRRGAGGGSRSRRG